MCRRRSLSSAASRLLEALHVEREREAQLRVHLDLEHHLQVELEALQVQYELAPESNCSATVSAYLALHVV